MELVLISYYKMPKKWLINVIACDKPTAYLLNLHAQKDLTYNSRVHTLVVSQTVYTH